MYASYCDQFVLPLPAEHRFPMDKYRRLRHAALRRGVLLPEDLHVPDPVTDVDLQRAHTRRYVTAVTTGTLERAAQRRIGFPWSRGARRTISGRSAGGTIAACRAALRDGAAVNLAGGTPPRLRGPWRGLLRVQRRGHRAARAPGRERRATCRGDRL